MARSRKTPTETDIQKIERLAGQGFRLEDIAIACDISVSTLQKWKDTPEVERAYRKGRIEATSNVANRLYTLAMEGEVAACIFWLKAQAGWSDRPQPEATAHAEVHIYLPDNGRAVAA
ncbi:hypothetical protein IQ265_13775 [Nodosilinea sp. LEGE 06152]|uniref:hypothetical protein n=1 Tax=Nodosilinea sp. LEGE 06152 TaxID=2777966 RepID=UPI001881029A|nr:hypothetical protein [Nodosilinea sp. LEGE 06152]MBE9157885.1 hypothetical protein [Nodosilinea sp. LEGE 06152]